MDSDGVSPVGRRSSLSFARRSESDAKEKERAGGGSDGEKAGVRIVSHTEPLAPAGGERLISPQSLPCDSPRLFPSEIEGMPDPEPAEGTPNEPYEKRSRKSGAYWKEWIDRLRDEGASAGRPWDGSTAAEGERLVQEHAELLAYAAHLERQVGKLTSRYERAKQYKARARDLEAKLAGCACTTSATTFSSSVSSTPKEAPAVAEGSVTASSNEGTPPTAPLPDAAAAAVSPVTPARRKSGNGSGSSSVKRKGSGTNEGVSQAAAGATPTTSVRRASGALSRMRSGSGSGTVSARRRSSSGRSDSPAVSVPRVKSMDSGVGVKATKRTRTPGSEGAASQAPAAAAAASPASKHRSQSARSPDSKTVEPVRVVTHITSAAAVTAAAAALPERRGFAAPSTAGAGGGASPVAARPSIVPRLNITRGAGLAANGVLPGPAAATVADAAADSPERLDKIQQVSMLLEVDAARARELLVQQQWNVHVVANVAVSTTPRVPGGSGLGGRGAAPAPAAQHADAIDVVKRTLVVSDSKARELLVKHKWNPTLAINSAVSNTPRAVIAEEVAAALHPQVVGRATGVSLARLGAGRAPAQPHPPVRSAGSGASPRYCFVVRHSTRADDTYFHGRGSHAWTAGADGRGFDPPITRDGEATALVSARAIMKRIPKNSRRDMVVVSSPYRRCLQTAEELCKVIPACMTVHYGLAEMHQRRGTWDGDATPSFDLPNYDVISDRELPTYPESLKAAETRFVTTIEQLVNCYYSTQNVVVVTHGPALDFMALRVTQRSRRVASAAYCGWLQLAVKERAPLALEHSEGLDIIDACMDA